MWNISVNRGYRLITNHFTTSVVVWLYIICNRAMKMVAAPKATAAGRTNNNKYRNFRDSQ